MAFTGNPIVKLVSSTVVRITGVSLIEGAVGTIGLHEHAGNPNIRLPAGFQPRPYDLDDAPGPVTLQDSVMAFVNRGVANPSTARDTTVDKAGATPQDFLISVTNPDNVGQNTTGPLEIYILFHN